MYNFRVLRITNNIEDYPDCEKDTLEFPDLVEHVSDEMDIFIFNLETGNFWKAGDFFYEVSLSGFYVRDGIKE